MWKKSDWLHIRNGILIFLFTVVIFLRSPKKNPFFPKLYNDFVDHRDGTENMPGSCSDALDSRNYEKTECTVANMHKNIRNLGSSLNGKLILMIGDSRTMQLFRYLRSLLSGRFYEERLFDNADVVAHFEDPGRNLTMQFYFKPLPDQATMDIIHQWTVIRNRKPDYLFYETGAWTLFIHGPLAEAGFRENITDIADAMAESRNVTTPIWIRTIPVHPDVPNHKPGWVNHRYNHTDILLERFGEVVEEVARAHQFTVWNSAHHIAKNNPQYYHDKVHPGLAMLRLVSRGDVVFLTG